MEFEALDQLQVGQSRVLTDSEVTALWGETGPQYSPANAVAALQSALPQEEYEGLFPYRIGTPAWHEYSADKPHYRGDETDYYSYDNLVAAITEVANIKYKVEYREGDPDNSRVYRLDKATKTETLIYQNAGFDFTENKTAQILSQTVDFGSFIKEGNERNRKRELAAFLANIAHETGGGTPASPGFPLAWGLYWNEEISCINTTGIHYVEENDSFPPVPGKSYHGRGPIQLSWNYNYGLISGIIFGNKDKLLQEPESIVQDGKLAFMTALLFWMTPQSPKPSAHDVIVGNWTPSDADRAKGLSQPGFGITIMIINGNLEGNLDEFDRRIARRVGLYRIIAARMGISTEGEKLNTAGMSPF